MTQPKSPDQANVLIDPHSCEVLEGHQHAIAEVSELVESIAVLGQLNPVQIIEYADGTRQIAAGRRRWEACKALGIQLRADIWISEHDEDYSLENLARSIRIAENVQRESPSAIDIAYQLRCIRNETGIKSAEELGRHLGMIPSRVKRYLSVLKASEKLLEICQNHSMPLAVVVELARLEKKVGSGSAGNAARRVAKGDLGYEDLRRLRTKTASKQPTSGSRKATAAERLERATKTVMKAIADDPAACKEGAQHLASLLTPYCQPPVKRAKEAA